jgi:hypothetical protein
MTLQHRGGNFEGDGLWGVYAGTVVNRTDPDLLGRVTVVVPGIVEPESAWALPRHGGAKRWGRTHVPPVGADVFVQFVNGDANVPIWEPGPCGLEEQFLEHEHADVSVWGAGPFRLVIDNRTDVQTAAFRVVKEVAGTEEVIVELLFNAATNSARLWATTALQLASEGVVDVDCAGDVQVKGRKVIPCARPVN